MVNVRFWREKRKKLSILSFFIFFILNIYLFIYFAVIVISFETTLVYSFIFLLLSISCSFHTVVDAPFSIKILRHLCLANGKSIQEYFLKQISRSQHSSFSLLKEPILTLSYFTKFTEASEKSLPFLGKNTAWLLPNSCLTCHVTWLLSNAFLALLIFFPFFMYSDWVIYTAIILWGKIL